MYTLLTLIIPLIISTTNGLSCCTLHSKEATCVAESQGTEDTICTWIDNPQDPIAVSAGDYQCVSTHFYDCKQLDITAKCTPPGGGPAEPAPAPPGEPAGPPLPPDCDYYTLTTPSPVPATPSPTALCELGVNYEVVGKPCTMSGDPHTYMFNGVRHDFQGQPLKGPDQFYYVHHCHDSDTTEMPFNIMARHFKWGKYDPSGIDYLTIELFDHNGDKYYIYLHSKWAKIAAAGPNVDAIYDRVKDSDLADLVSNKETYIGHIFNILFIQESSSKVSLQLVINDECTVTIMMQYQTYNTADPLFPARPPRYRMHYVYIEQSECYKCVTCGLCGSFSFPTQTIETCDGRNIAFRPGYDARTCPEAYDLNGWTWEKNFVTKKCGEHYDNTNNNGNDFVPEELCPDKPFQEKVKKHCASARDLMKPCCDNIIGSTTCDDLEEDCNNDVCIDSGGDILLVQPSVKNIFISAIDMLCKIPGIGDKNSDFSTGLVVGMNPGHYGAIDIGKDKFNDLFKNSPMGIIQRLCEGCEAEFRQVYYRRRKTDGEIDDFDAYSNMKVWTRIDNQLHINFRLFSTLKNAIQNTNAWGYCNYNTGVGAFGDCAPQQSDTNGDNWCSDDFAGRECKFSIHMGMEKETAEYVSNEDFAKSLMGEHNNKNNVLNVKNGVIMSSNYGLNLQNGYMQILIGIVFIVMLYGILKCISGKSNDKYIPISDPITKSTNSTNYI